MSLHCENAESSAMNERAMEVQDSNLQLEYEEIKKKLERLEQENKSLKLQSEKNENEGEKNSKQIFLHMRNDESLKKERMLINIRDHFERVEREYKILKEKCSVSSLHLKKNTIEEIKTLKAAYESTVLKRNIASVGQGASLVGRFAAYLKNSDPALKLALVGASMLCSQYVNHQRQELRELSKKIGNLLSADFQRYKAFVNAAEGLDEALRRHFGLSLYSMEFRRLCFTISSSAGEIAEEKKVADFMQSLTKNLQERLKDIPQNQKLSEILKKLANDTLLTDIRSVVSQHYLDLFFRFLPDLIDQMDPEAFLVPAHFFCEAILFVSENKMDSALLNEVDDNIERMKNEFKVMFELYEYCKAIGKE